MNIAREPFPEFPFIKKVAGWFYRYAPSEVIGTASALLSAGVAAQLGGSMLVIAIVGAWGEALGFYIPMAVREFIRVRQKRSPLAALIPTLRNLLLEFGAAELLDTGLLRPGLMAVAMHLLASDVAALIAGKIAADLFFYGLAIGGYELRQRLDDRISNTPIRKEQ